MSEVGNIVRDSGQVFHNPLSGDLPKLPDKSPNKVEAGVKEGEASFKTSSPGDTKTPEGTQLHEELTKSHWSQEAFDTVRKGLSADGRAALARALKWLKPGERKQVGEAVAELKSIKPSDPHYSQKIQDAAAKLHKYLGNKPIVVGLIAAAGGALAVAAATSGSDKSGANTQAAPSYSDAASLVPPSQAYADFAQSTPPTQLQTTPGMFAL